MAIYQALGAGPVSFVDENLNQQELPLSAVFFTANGLDASSSPLNTAGNQAVISALLKQMAAQGYLAPGSQPLSPPTLEFTAAQAGPMGNTISIVVSNPSPSLGTVDIEVTATDVYSDLAPGALAAALGTSAATATGLVYFVSGSGNMPAGGSKTIPAGFEVSFLELTDATATAFTVAATNQSDAADAEKVTVAVALGSGASPTTFDLTVSWSAPATGVTLASLLTTNPFAYLVTVTGQSGPLPAAGTVTLTGGKAATGSDPAVAASASLLASS
jgi:hypothetical protein